MITIIIIRALASHSIHCHHDHHYFIVHGQTNITDKYCHDHHFKVHWELHNTGDIYGSNHSSPSLTKTNL